MAGARRRGKYFPVAAGHHLRNLVRHKRQAWRRNPKGLIGKPFWPP